MWYYITILVKKILQYSSFYLLCTRIMRIQISCQYVGVSHYRYVLLQKKTVYIPVVDIYMHIYLFFYYLFYPNLLIFFHLYPIRLGVCAYLIWRFAFQVFRSGGCNSCMGILVALLLLVVIAIS